jgi:hypothetical protein
MPKIFAKIVDLFRNGRAFQVSRRTGAWRRSPSVNVNGTPMIGKTDIHGRSYGSVRGYRSGRYGS